MAGIDRAAIVFSIAIALIGVGVAVVGDSIDYSPSTTIAPKVMKDTSEPKAQTDPFADLAEKVKSETPKMEEKKVVVKEEVKMEETKEKPIIKEEKPMMEKTGPKTHKVEIPVGTSVPGCEETNTCYSPAKITIKAGDTVQWVNVDTAAHTVTGGSPADGPSGVFDSSLVMANANYAFTFDKAGSYKYFCMVHPWMVGSVTVN
ncbi:MAG: hypothetical protein K5790_04435 [Nitrosopumilus sp.]|uniref:cupredoxin domain-containing protein n=1 Tax=Nitrosopumilus sp. TaxID=2024843 RepID=UPI00247CB0BE|nr:plastocyanin/azurin family copper-binding protein [Nitrosopumilus sp.]MCV0392527.1 hypothetical protein [Nitrosopumilus sp.]